jgi:hypothetical protein
MIVKHSVIVSDDNVIARIIIFGVKPNCCEVAGCAISLDEGVGEDVAGAAGKEHSVW